MISIKGETMNQAALLTPAFVLILWTFTIFLIMAYGRVKYTKNPKKNSDTVLWTHNPFSVSARAQQVLMREE